MDDPTRAQLFQLGAMARKAGLNRALKWLMARMAEDEEAGKRRSSKRRVALGRVRGSQAEFYVDSELLRQAEDE